MIRGIGTSKGIGIGHALIIDEPQIEAKTEIVSDTAAELRRYENVKKKFIADTQNIIEELRQNIRMILLTFAGSCPLARELALDSGLIDKPVNIVENIIYANLKRAIEENEPRVNLKQINIKNDLENLGKLVITVIVEVKDEYI